MLRKDSQALTAGAHDVRRPFFLCQAKAQPQSKDLAWTSLSGFALKRALRLFAGLSASAGSNAREAKRIRINNP
jgi:hypothetical protein